MDNFKPYFVFRFYRSFLFVSVQISVYRFHIVTSICCKIGTKKGNKKTSILANTFKQDTRDVERLHFRLHIGRASIELADV